MTTPNTPLEVSTPLDAEVETDEQRERFRIEDDRAATWAMRRLYATESKVREFEQIAAEEIARVNDWLAQVIAPLDRDRNYFTGLLTQYARQQRDAEGRKSIALPHGKITSRATSPKWHVNDEQTIEWARMSCPDVIVTKESLSLTAMKERFQVADGRAIDENGEVVPGVVIDPAGVSYSINTEA